MKRDAEAPLAVPFPWLEGKTAVAPDIWARLGDVPIYVEPFARSLAVLFARPHPSRVETINDRDSHVVNFWRALKADPHGVAFYANLPIYEVDLQTRYRWLVTTAATRIARVADDPAYYDTQSAGWWLCGRYRPVSVSTLWRISMRLRKVRISCSQWTQIVTEIVTATHGLTGIFFDPPYGYADVRAWAIAHGEHPHLRIALCGYEGERPMPAGWTYIEWQQVDSGEAARRVWFSPACLPKPHRQTDLFPTFRAA